MIYYADDFVEMVKFYHGLLKGNGRLMIVLEAGKFVVTPQTLTNLPRLSYITCVSPVSSTLLREERFQNPVEDVL